jgi:ribonucleotide reductase beta subunit family protein with ferritin-like domain
MPSHPVKVGVWVTMSRRRIIIAIFFNETIHAQRYQRLFAESFVNQPDDVELTKSYCQQDSATAHTARTSLNYLYKFFPGRLINDQADHLI